MRCGRQVCLRMASPTNLIAAALDPGMCISARADVGGAAPEEVDRDGVRISRCYLASDRRRLRGQRVHTGRPPCAACMPRRSVRGGRRMTEWSFGSAIYGGAWATPEMRALFADVPRTRRWLDLLALLADVQAEHGIIPADAAQDIQATCRSIEVDDGFLAECRERIRSNRPLDSRPDRRR